MRLFSLTYVYFSYLLVKIQGSYDAKEYQKITLSYCGPVRLDDGWWSDSQTTCAIECRERYEADCRGFLYNQYSHVCVPSSGLSGHSDPPIEAEGEFYFASDCNAYPDFSVYLGLRYALINKERSYELARSTCQCLNARLIVVDNINSWNVLWLAAGLINNVWLGLDDIAQSDHFVWSNGQPLDPIWRSLIFYPTEPRNIGDCVYKLAGNYFINTTDCASNLTFVCEQPYC
ncbi:CD209 antigen [Biomphalaria glabrata]|uniref:CD209 antigen-like n=1 Tax=Biomphalaria glabrata TaxID=6526 RepID=A0A9U8DXI3_BIOGL|nr:CD209 antigen-like [Biomphalaria glabrata]